MFGIINRYLAVSFLGPFLVSSLFFVLFLLTFQLFRVVKIFLAKGVGMGSLLELMGYIALTFVPLAIPIAILFSTIFTMNKICSDSEFVAMRAIGLTKEKLFAPFLIFSLMIGITVFALNSDIIPYSKREFRKAVNILTSKGLISEIQKGNFFTEIPNVIVFTENVDQESKMMSNIFIDVREGGEERFIYAKTGKFKKESDNKWGVGDLRLLLEDGSIVTRNEKNEELEKIIFQTYDFPIISGDISVGNIDKGSMKSSKDLWSDLKSTPLEERKDKSYVKSEIEFWSRINTPILIVVFTLLGFSLGVQKSRGRARGTGSISFMILVAYYALFFAGISAARSHAIPSYIAVFLPTVIGVFSGIYFFRKIEWIS